MLEADKILYLREKRKKLFLALAVVMIFGLVLYSVNVFSKKKSDDEDQTVSGGLFDIAKKIDNESASEGINDIVSENILKSPVSLPFIMENNKLILQENLKIKKREILNGVFTVNSHGDTIYSVNFSSSEKSLLCKGAMKRGSDRFFIYFCADKNPE